MRALFIMTPHEGSLITPIPRKLIKTSVLTAAGKRRVKVTMMTWKTLGRMWRKRMRGQLSPSAFAAIT